MTARDRGTRLRVSPRLALVALAAALGTAFPRPAEGAGAAALVAPLAASIDVPDTAAARAHQARTDSVPALPAAPDTSRGRPAIVDTARALPSDSARAGQPAGVWKMDDLKVILGSETAGLEAGGKYRERKNGRVAMLCSLLLPGLGQMYNEKPIKAAVVYAVEWYYLGNIYYNRRLWEHEKMLRNEYPGNSPQWVYHDRWVKYYWDRSVDWIWWSSAIVVISVIDAYVDAHLDDMRFRVKPRVTGSEIGVALVIPY